ncbi:MAG: 3-oxoacyl-[Kiritimatiellae bacterium]|nr:3-oxoacyl-[acyl-carrier-protein] reductase [Kiritimatiellia bacterium]
MGAYDFTGKVAIVTGAARGIGQAIALKLAEGGANVAICDLNAEWLEETKAQVEALGVKALPLAVDVGDGEQVAATVDAVVKAFGTVDIMVNNAGITKDGLMIRMSEADWDAVLRVNLKGVFLFTKTVARVMMKQRSGAIVNIASVVGIMGNAGQANYTASKGGVIALTKTTAKEFGSRGIRCNAVAPGFISSKMTDVLSQEVRDKYMEQIPLRNFGTQRDVANAVAFLASSEASYVTGQVLSVNGGMI